MEKGKDTFLFSRKELKNKAKTNLKHHYLMYVLACLFALIMQVEFLASDNVLGASKRVIFDATQAVYEFTGVQDVKRIEDAYREIDEDAGSLYSAVEEALYNKTLKSVKANEMFGRTKGILNQVINYVTENTIISNIYSIIVVFAGSESVAEVIMTALILLVAAFAWLYVRNVYVAVCRRIFLEGRIYKKIPFSRYLFFIRMKRWTRASFVMALKTVFELLGMASVIGFPVVHCGLMLVPYIIAENPDVKPVEALKLSWNMMKGNKWKVFVMFMSFIGWYILGTFTLGLANLFFTNPYIVCCYSEFYAKIRQHSIDAKIPGTELLNDKYLFAGADEKTLTDTYSDVLTEIGKPEYSLESLEGPREKFFAKNFGVVLWNSKDEIEYENNQAYKMKMQGLEKEAKGSSYPSRLSPIPEQRKIPYLDSIHYMRHYSLTSLLMMFFIFSNFGWTWELLYYFLMKGKLINRGVLHGPWLPIYGFGGLFVLVLLHKLRKRPLLFFVGTIVLCGTVEYITGWALEVIFGAKWWDYSGYFLNLNGRISAEGLLVFGICGMAFIYVLAPLLDNLIRKINRKVLLVIGLTLLVLIISDTIYSKFVPNTGYGITGSFDRDEDIVTVESTVDI